MVDDRRIVNWKFSPVVYVQVKCIKFWYGHREKTFEFDWKIFSIYFGMWLLTLPVVSEGSLRHFYRSSLEIFVVIIFNEEPVGSTILLVSLHSFTVEGQFTRVGNLCRLNFVFNDDNLGGDFFPLNFQIFQKIKQLRHKSILLFNIWNDFLQGVLLFFYVFEFIHDLGANRLQFLHGETYFVHGDDFGLVIVVDILSDPIVV